MGIAWSLHPCSLPDTLDERCIIYIRRRDLILSSSSSMSLGNTQLQENVNTNTEACVRRDHS